MFVHFAGRSSAAQRAAAQAYLAFYGAFLVIAGSGAVIASWYLSRQTGRRPTILWLALFSGFWVVSLMAHMVTVHSTAAAAVVWWWGGLTLASPLGAVMIWGWNIMYGFLRPRDLDEHLAEAEQRAKRQEERLSRKAHDHASAAGGETEAGHLTLGVFIKGDARFPEYVGIKRKQAWVLFSEKLLSQHLLLIGATGVGKTETIRHLVVETLRATDRDIFLIDGKGDEALGRQVAQLIYQYRWRARCPSSRWDWTNPARSIMAFVASR